MANDRAAAATAAAYARWAGCDDWSAATRAPREAARSALDARLVQDFEIDLDAPNGARRLAAARSAYFRRLALRSAKARPGPR